MTPDEQEQEATTEATPPAAAPPEAAAPEVAATPVEAPAAPAASGEAGQAPAAPTAPHAPGPRPERGPRRDSGDGEGPRRRHFGRRRVCMFCAEKVKSIDYKDSMRLRRFLSDRARIEPRRKTGTCAKHQRWLAVALKRARHLALLPYTPEHIRVSGVSTGRGR